jgi:hypothetical protein
MAIVFEQDSMRDYHICQNGDKRCKRAHKKISSRRSTDTTGSKKYAIQHVSSM